MWEDFDVKGQWDIDFLLEEALLWIIMDILSKSDDLKIKRLNDGFVSYKHAAFRFTRCYLWIIVMFLSAVWTLILTAPIHCRGSTGEQVMYCYISLNLFSWGNKLICISDALRVSKLYVNVKFLVNYSFKHTGACLQYCRQVALLPYCHGEGTAAGSACSQTRAQGASMAGWRGLVN